MPKVLKTTDKEGSSMLLGDVVQYTHPETAHEELFGTLVEIGYKRLKIRLLDGDEIYTVEKSAVVRYV